MAFEACKVHGITVPAVFDDYVKRLVNIEVVSDDETNPTEGAPTLDH
jgi:hypothetical protein